MTENTAALQLTPIGALLAPPYRFVIPDYQRGYRWTKWQVNDLLGDLWEFSQSDPAPSDFYCLQPVVVARVPADPNNWEVIDGQQRLTTIYLILKYLHRVRAINPANLFNLSYNTRNGSADFLEQIDDDLFVERKKQKNVDFHHMAEAWEAIETWFHENCDAAPKIASLLTAKDSEHTPSARIIWYEVPPAEAQKTFLRLNTGRIPLNSAELIRARFLLHGDAHDARMRIAYEWDLIEQQLHEDRYWYFLQNHTTADTWPVRIEYLFEIFTHLVDPRANKSTPTDADFDTYVAFDSWFHDSRSPSTLIDKWRSFRSRVADMLREWFEDRTTFHLIGYLVATADTRDTPGLLKDLLTRGANQAKTRFEDELRQRAWGRLFFTSHWGSDDDRTLKNLEEYLCDITYEQRDRVRRALLLFNVASVLQAKAPTHWFHFDAYKLTSWDIEHIDPLAQFVPSREDEKGQIDWLTYAKDELASNGPTLNGTLNQEVTEILKKSSTADERGDLIERVREALEESNHSGDKNLLSNLALLDSSTNRSYKNALFPQKRQKIIEAERDGIFIPPCTRNVFLKYYSEEDTKLFRWNQGDQDAYQAAIIDTLTKFFGVIAGQES